MYSYYLSGGLAAVIYTDTLCTTLMTVGSLIVAIMGKTTLISITCFCSLENYIKDVNIVSSSWGFLGKELLKYHTLISLGPLDRPWDYLTQFSSVKTEAIRPSVLVYHDWRESITLAYNCEGLRNTWRYSTCNWDAFHCVNHTRILRNWWLQRSSRQVHGSCIQWNTVLQQYMWKTSSWLVSHAERSYQLWYPMARIHNWWNYHFYLVLVCRSGQ